jgi:hypothetical protein
MSGVWPCNCNTSGDDDDRSVPNVIASPTIQCDCNACGDEPQPTPSPGGGEWYSRYDPEPINIIEAWGLDFHRATILQYLVRSDAKNGIEDLQKARWYIERLIEKESGGAR